MGTYVRIYYTVETDKTWNKVSSNVVMYTLSRYSN